MKIKKHSTSKSAANTQRGVKSVLEEHFSQWQLTTTMPYYYSISLSIRQDENGRNSLIVVQKSQI